MTTFHSFEEINAWKESRHLVRQIRSICKRPNVRRDFTIIDQITRSARSISANIAEGNHSLTVPEFIGFLGYAKRSSSEVRSHLYDALDEQYISKAEFDDLFAQTQKIARMLSKLISYLYSLDLEKKRIGKFTH